MAQNGGHLRINFSGMVCPRSGEFFAIEASHSDAATYQAFFDQAILDGIDNPQKTKKPPLSERYSDKRSNARSS